MAKALSTAWPARILDELAGLAPRTRPALFREAIMRIPVIAALALLTPVAAAEEPLPVRGYGALTCEQALRVPFDDPSTKWALRDWIAGFVSGINVSLSSQQHRHFDLRGPWANFMYFQLLAACSTRPDDMFADLVLEEIARTPQAPD